MKIEQEIEQEIAIMVIEGFRNLLLRIPLLGILEQTKKGDVMKVKSKLLFISVVAFVGFLIAYGKAFYEWGFNNSLTGLTLIFLFPIFYFILTVVALVLMHKNSFDKLPYIVMSVLSTAFMVIKWLIYFFVRLAEDTERIFMFHQELWFPIILSILSVVISIGYISILVEIVKDKCVSRGEN